MKHVYLAPHLDDAVLSCGGAIHRHMMARDQVLVVTVFAAEFEGENPSAFAREQHAYWGNPPQPMALRRAEDVAALTRLGAGVRHLRHLDAVYRAGPDHQWLYPSVEALFGEPHPADPMAPASQGIKELTEQLTALVARGQTVVYAPLGVGGHVDHRAVHVAARQLLAAGYSLAFYEDYPYAERAAGTELSPPTWGGSRGGQATRWRCEWIALDAPDLVAKVSALGYYRSQMAVLFGGAEAMPSRVWTFAATRSAEGGLFERLWWPLEV